MDKREFDEVHKECSDALKKYTAASKRLCELLSNCAAGPVSIQHRSEIVQQRALENHLQSEYNEVRLRLLSTAHVGFDVI